MTQLMSKWTIEHIPALCVLLLSLLLVSANACAEETILKHQDLFYPDGMPMVSGVDGVNRQSEYYFYSEDHLPDSNKDVVLFSEITYIGGDIEDIYKPHNVYVALLKDGNQVMSKVKVTMDMARTDGYTDDYYKMGGTLNHFGISPDIEAVHVYLWGVVAGSGGQEYGSDHIYEIDYISNTITPILDIYNTFRYGRLGAGTMHAENTLLYIADIDNDGMMEIMTRKNFQTRIDEENINEDTWSDIIDVYRYNKTEIKYEPAGQINELPADAVELKTFE